MELYKNTSNNFINYLLDNGYLADSIVTEWRSKVVSRQVYSFNQFIVKI